MAERPIIFSGPMVRALLSGAKTQTRRMVKPQPARGCHYVINGAGTHALHFGDERDAQGGYVCVPPTARSKDHRLPCPYGAPGDRLWVRETWCDGDPWMTDGGYSNDPPETIRYAADNSAVRYANTDFAHAVDGVSGWSAPKRWRSPLFLPRWASRITLEVTGVRVGRLHAITEADARAEGVETLRGPDGAVWVGSSARAMFAGLWAEINGENSWNANPYVWVVSFRRVESEARGG